MPAVVTVESRTGVSDLELLLLLPPGIGVADGDSRVALGLAAGRAPGAAAEAERRALGRLPGRRPHPARPRRPRRLPLGGARSRAAAAQGYPRPERVDDLLQPERTQVSSGNYVSRERGEGIEFADLRPFAPGDRVRRINWRASARRASCGSTSTGRSATPTSSSSSTPFAEAADEEGTTLDLAVARRVRLRRPLPRHKDRVGFVAFGGRLNWLAPRTGWRSSTGSSTALVDSGIVLNYAWSDVDVLPRQTLPPRSLIVALTPLLDDRSTSALLDLRGRGFDLAVVEVSPLPFVPAGKGHRAELAHRIWRLERDVARARFERAGVAVGTWDDEVSLVGALEEVRAFRRFAARGHA